MEHLLQVTTEVNGEKVVKNKKIWLEYPEKENRRYLAIEARNLAAITLGVSEFKVKEAKDYIWTYEEYNKEKHKSLIIIEEDYEDLILPKDE